MTNADLSVYRFQDQWINSDLDLLNAMSCIDSYEAMQKKSFKWVDF